MGNNFTDKLLNILLICIFLTLFILIFYSIITTGDGIKGNIYMNLFKDNGSMFVFEFKDDNKFKFHVYKSDSIEEYDGKYILDDKDIILKIKPDDSDDMFFLELTIDGDKLVSSVTSSDGKVNVIEYKKCNKEDVYEELVKVKEVKVK